MRNDWLLSSSLGASMNLFSMLPPLALAANLSVAAWQSDWLERARSILNQQWDPMGHHSTYCTDDEYDEICDLLAIVIGAGASDTMLLGYLEGAEVDWTQSVRALGAPPQPERLASL